VVGRRVTLGTNKEKLWEHGNAGKFFSGKNPYGRPSKQTQVLFFEVALQCFVTNSSNNAIRLQLYQFCNFCRKRSCIAITSGLWHLRLSVKQWRLRGHVIIKSEDMGSCRRRSE